MGIDIGSKLIVGLPANELLQYHEDKIHNGDLSTSSFYYDAGFEDQIAGIDVYGTDSNAKEIDFLILSDKFLEASKKFKEITGLDGKLYLCPNVW